MSVMAVFAVAFLITIVVALLCTGYALTGDNIVGKTIVNYVMELVEKRMGRQ